MHRQAPARRQAGFWGLSRILACALLFAGSCRAFVLLPLPRRPSEDRAVATVQAGRVGSGQALHDGLRMCSRLELLGKRRPSAEPWWSSGLLRKRWLPAVAASRSRRSMRSVLSQIRGEARGSKGGRQGSGIPYVDPPGGPKLRAMYLCQTLSGFADRMWEFSIPFFLLALSRPDSMALAIFYAVVAGLTNVAGGPVVGYAVDKYPRLPTVTVCLMLQTCLVLLSYLAMRTALSLTASSSGTIAALVVILTISSSAASLASLASTHAIERDWIKCLNRYEVCMHQSRGRQAWERAGVGANGGGDV